MSKINIKNKESSFEELLEMDEYASIHIRNPQPFAIYIYKVMNGGSPEIMNEVSRFREENRYYFGHQNTFIGPIVNTVYNSTETVSKSLKVWELIFTQLKNWFLWIVLRKQLKNGDKLTALEEFVNLTYAMFAYDVKIWTMFLSRTLHFI